MMKNLGYTGQISVAIITFVLLLFSFSPFLLNSRYGLSSYLPDFMQTAHAFSCADPAHTEICTLLGLSPTTEIEVFEDLPFATNYTPDDVGLLVAIFDVLYVLTIGGMVYVVIVMFKVLLYGTAIWGEPSEERFATAKKKFIEIAKAMLLPMIGAVLIIISAFIFGVKSPFDPGFINATFQGAIGRRSGRISWINVISCVDQYPVSSVGAIKGCTQMELAICYKNNVTNLTQLRQCKPDSEAICIRECKRRDTVEWQAYLNNNSSPVTKTEFCEQRCK